MVNLQNQYDLKAEEIKNGIPKGLQLNASLPADLCYFLGKTCFDYNDHLCTIDWLSSCLNSTSDIQTRQKIIKLLYTSYIFLSKWINTKFIISIQRNTFIQNFLTLLNRPNRKRLQICSIFLKIRCLRCSYHAHYY